MAHDARYERRRTLRQFGRFATSGGIVTLLAVLVYWIGADVCGVPAVAANGIAYAVCLAIGYMMHSRWSFAGHDAGTTALGTSTRYVLISLVGLAINSLWVWALVVRLRGPTWLPIAPMVFVTPVMMFALNRRWVFARRPAAFDIAAGSRL